MMSLAGNPRFKTKSFQEKEKGMNSLKKVVLWLLATGLVLAAAAMLIPKKAVASLAAQVFVTNSTVPVSGNVAITGTPTVQLPPESNIGVHNLVSTPLFTRPWQGLMPFHTRLCGGTNSLGEIICEGALLPSSVTVGENQQLVIEYVSAFCHQDGTGEVFESYILTTVGGQEVPYIFPIGQPDGQGSARFNQQVRIYADPGSTISYNSSGSTGRDGRYICLVSLSGNIIKP
jgi:hypothetical protein